MSITGLQAQQRRVLLQTSKKNADYKIFYEKIGQVGNFRGKLDVRLDAEHSGKSLSPDLPVGCTVTEGAVERGRLGGGPGGLVAGVLRGPGLVLSVRGHGAQTSQTDWEPVISSWSSGLSVKITLGFKI